MKKISAVILIISFLILILAGCGEKQESDSNVAVETTAEAPAEEIVESRLEADVPADANFGGYEFKVLVRNSQHMIFESVDFLAEEQTGDIINDAVYLRNRAVEEKLNIKIIAEKVFQPFTYIKKMVVAGDDLYDMYVDSTDSMVSMATVGYIYNFYDIPYLDLTKPWWDQSMEKELTFDHKLYGHMGDITLSDNYGTWGLLFNKKIHEDLQLEDIYDLVRKGKWTIFKFYEMIKQGVKDVNGDGNLHVLDDQLGFATETYNSFVMLTGAGERIAMKDENDLPVITMNNEKFYSAYNTILEIQKDKTCVMDAAWVTGVSDIWYDGIIPSFGAGRILFYMGSMALVPNFRSMEQPFGILPIPKYDEAQSTYYTTMSTGNNGVAYVPTTSSDITRTGIIIESLSAESYHTLTPAYYDIALKSKHARDEESAEMLDILFANRRLDVAMNFNIGGLASLITSQTANLASSYEKVEVKAQKDIEKLIESFNKTEE